MESIVQLLRRENEGRKEIEPGKEDIQTQSAATTFPDQDLADTTASSTNSHDATATNIDTTTTTDNKIEGHNDGDDDDDDNNNSNSVVSNSNQTAKTNPSIEQQNGVPKLKSPLDPTVLKVYSTPLPTLNTSLPPSSSQPNVNGSTKFAPLEKPLSTKGSVRWKNDERIDGPASKLNTTSRESDPLGPMTNQKGALANRTLSKSASNDSLQSRGRSLHHEATNSSAVMHDGVSGPSSTLRKSLDYSTGDETETPASRRATFLSKLKALGRDATHGRTLSGWTFDSGDDATPTPGSNNHFHFMPGAVGEGAERNDGYPDGPGRRRSFSPSGSESRTAPTTPRSGPRRRATMNDIPEESLNTRRPSSSHEPYRRGTPSFRRFAAFDYFRNYESGSEREPQTPGGHISGSIGRWRAIRDRVMGKGRKEDSRVDREKSAELVAELTAATPAAVMLASMFQRDEHGNKRIPILLEQLKVRVVDSKPPGKGNSRYHTTFKIELEYGSGLMRMKWVVHREFRDFINLHSRYRLADISNTTFGGREAHKLPKFPRATIPYLKTMRGLGNDDEDDADQSEPEDRGAETPRDLSLFTPDTPGPSNSIFAAQTPYSPPATSPKPQKIGPFWRKSSTPGTPIDNPTGVFPVDNPISMAAAGIGTLVGAIGGGGSTIGPLTTRRGDTFAVRQRQKLEQYLQALIRIMIFRPDSNRLCKFLELSALGVRLSAENSYHGKEGFLAIRSAKGSDFKKGIVTPWSGHHQPKWFLVRHSYLVCVDGPEDMNIYDVFLVDSKFEVDAWRFLRKKAKGHISTSNNPAHPQHHSFTVKNSERQLKLVAKNERQLLQFLDSINFMRDNTLWSGANRLGSFAPVRKNVIAQWLVDGRDYMWNVSKAIMMAKDVIYIHDWWLSPELYLRRPAAVSQKWRLDRLLQQKAREGVKIFVIVYRNIGAAVPIDSSYTKYSLLDLHPNVFVQRSPNQIRQNTFFWAHHEKILIVDHMVAFVGGIDLCFGRWDTPQHSLRDDKPTGFDNNNANKDPDDYQLWPGKDYSNPRVLDFTALDKPYEDMYDRCKVPRMPWHDISMQIVGQPARDLTRHFVQRWNYLLRQRKPSRPTPVLLPPPDFTEEELQSLGIEGTCEVQILRSSCAWSTGTPYMTEHSILNAYLKTIETSEHFVYIENQFFITSCEWEGSLIENSIGDALVERIVRAHRNDEDWRAIILIPLMPGFQNTVDSQDGTSVRLIMQLQYRSISRGDSSIFGKLRNRGIQAEDYIQFYGLRNWGKIGPEDALVTEQLYIHAKTMVVDDRVAIIGSANINERSMLGNRDSEVAALVRDTDTMMSTMAGRPYRVGKFPHTLRLRLMREHLGLDVDELMCHERKLEAERFEEEWQQHVKQWEETKGAHDSPSASEYPREAPPTDGSLGSSAEHVSTPRASRYGLTNTTPKKEEAVLRAEELLSFNHDVDWEQQHSPHIKANKKESQDPRISENPKHRKDVAGFGHDNMHTKEEAKKKKKSELSFKQYINKENKHGIANSLPPWETRSQDSGISPTTSPKRSAVAAPTSQTSARRQSVTDTATTSTRSSSRATNDSVSGSGNGGLPPCNVAKLNSDEMGLPQTSTLPTLPKTNGAETGGPSSSIRPVSHGSSNVNIALQDMTFPEVYPDIIIDPLDDSFYFDVWHQCALNNTRIFREVFRCMPDNEVKTWKEYKEYAAYQERFSQAQLGSKGSTRRQQEASGKSGPPGTATSSIGGRDGGAIGSIGETLSEKAHHLHVPLPHHGGENQGQGTVKEWATAASQSPQERENVEKGDKPPGTNQGEPLHKIASTTSLPGSVTFSEPQRDNPSFLESLKPGSPKSQDSASSKPPTSRGTQATQEFNERRPQTGSNSDAALPSANLSASSGISANCAHTLGTVPGPQAMPSVRRRRRGTRGSRREFHSNEDLIDNTTAEQMLEKVQGHLVVWPYDWLIKAEDAGNWLYSIDQLAPIEIYD